MPASTLAPDRSEGVHVIGAGGHAKVVIATLEQAGWTIAGVYDDDPQRIGTRILGHAVLGPVSMLQRKPGSPAVIGIGRPDVRQRLAARLTLTWVSAVHPAAWVHPSVTLGPGSLVFAGAVVQPDASLGAHVVVNTGASVDHDCVVGSFSNIGPGARLAGAVEVGSCCDLGTGCAVIPGIRVGSQSVVGAGAVVIRDVEERVVAAGCPARVLQRLHPNPSDREDSRAA